MAGGPVMLSPGHIVARRAGLSRAEQPFQTNTERIRHPNQIGAWTLDGVGMSKRLIVIVLAALAVSMTACAGGFPPQGNGRGILNNPDPMAGGGG